MLRRSIFSTSIILLLVAASLASAEVVSHSWSTSFGGALSDHVAAIETDAYGNVYVAGRFQGTMDLGGGPLVSYGGFDVFLAKFAPDGSHVWSQHFGGTSSDYCNDIEVDDYGFISMVGFYLGTADFGAGPMPNAGGYDIFVGRYDPNGANMWVGWLGSADAENAVGVANGTLGSVYIVGSFNGSLDIGPNTHNTVGLDDILLVKFDRAGDILWGLTFGSTDSDWAQDVVVDAGGNATLVSYGYGALDFGGGVLPVNGSLDIYMARFTVSGAHLWSQVLGGGSSDYAYSLALDSADNILMTGRFIGSADFGGGPLVASGWDAFVAKYDLNGTHLWSYAKGGGGNQFSNEVATDEADNVYIVGGFYGGADFGGGVLPNKVDSDMFIASYDSDGAHRWSRGFGGFQSDEAYGVATDPSGNVFLAGQFYYGIDFGGGVLLGSQYTDCALARFCQGPDIHSVLDIPGDQGGLVNVTWDRNSMDNTIDLGITEYSVWRAIDAAAATAMIEKGAALIDDPAQVKSAAAGQPIVRVAGNYYWYQVLTVGANQLESYSAPTATVFDSTGAGADYHYFQVIAHTAAPGVFYTSEVDSGYSVDNLAPAAPLNLVAAQQVAPDALALTWDPNSEPDIAGYEVYRGMSPGFVADGASLLGTSSEPTLLDTEWQWDSGYWYKVFAVDTHGNKSPYTMIGPNLVTGVGDTPIVSSLEQNVPNPFNPTTTIVFTLRESANVTLAIYDATGKHVRTLVRGAREAQRYDVTWDGHDDAGSQVASGVYFYRLSAGSFTQTKKMVLLK